MVTNAIYSYAPQGVTEKVTMLLKLGILLPVNKSVLDIYLNVCMSRFYTSKYQRVCV
jgi:hypothetical protein